MRTPRPTTFGQFRREAFGVEGCESAAPTALSAVQAFKLFSGGNSESKQTTTDRRVGSESGDIATEQAVQATEGGVAVADSGELVTGDKFSLENISGSEVNFGIDSEGLLSVLGQQSEENAKAVQSAVASQGENLSSALEKLSTAASAQQTEGASILTKQLGWVFVAILAFLGVVVWRLKK